MCPISRKRCSKLHCVCGVRCRNSTHTTYTPKENRVHLVSAIKIRTLCAVNVDRNPVSDRNSSLSARKPDSFYSPRKRFTPLGVNCRCKHCVEHGKEHTQERSQVGAPHHSQELQARGAAALSTTGRWWRMDHQDHDARLVRRDGLLHIHLAQPQAAAVATQRKGEPTVSQ